MDEDIQMATRSPASAASPLTPVPESGLASAPDLDEEEALDFEITGASSKVAKSRLRSPRPTSKPVSFQPTVPVSTSKPIFLSASGTRVPEEAGLVVQDQECRDIPGLPLSNWCRTCTYQQRLRTADLDVDTDYECSWKGSRGLSSTVSPKHDLAGSSKVSSTAHTAYLHQPQDESYELVDSAPPVKVLPSEGHELRNRAAVAMSGLTRGALHIIADERRQAANRHRHPVHRLGGAKSALQCGQCKCFFINSWQCTTCGTELCLDCFRSLAEEKASPLVDANDLRACVEDATQTEDGAQFMPIASDPEARQSPKHVPHLMGDFIPLTRLSVGALHIDAALARHCVASMKTPAELFFRTITADMQIKQDAAEPWGTTFRRRADKQTKGRYRNETFVVRAGSELAPKRRSELIETTLLALSEEAFVIQQDIVEPLTDDELRLLFKGDQDVDVRNVGPQDPDHTPLRTENWQWCELVDELTGKTKKTRYLDIRNGEEYVDGAVPHPPSKLCDISSWIADDLPQRDAKEKCYIAIRCQDMEEESTTLLHVDEAGAMNTLLWVRQQPKAVCRTNAPETPSGLLRLPPRPTRVNTKPVTQDELDGRPVGAQWLWWPPHARQHFERAAADCLARKQVAPWNGPVLFGQDFTATQHFIDRVAALGGEDCRARVIDQRVGETVVIPGGVPHQVRNLRTCFKVARDIMVPTHMEEVLLVQQERAASTATDSSWGRDATMVKPSIYTAWRMVAGDLLHDISNLGQYDLWRMVLNEGAASETRQVAFERRSTSDQKALLERVRLLEQREGSEAIFRRVKRWLRNLLGRGDSDDDQDQPFGL
ncbi:hypothetical protein OC842_006682 [Tilletia horrida]|uniref:JmjC domain-containing protein n=1 Tax=Tilletia horrida TaxID=155126 RepID=A0AAN6G521_9BASI|nr:hypothetical protein OC842_006682 [Tilletia horrida]